MGSRVVKRYPCRASLLRIGIGAAFLVKGVHKGWFVGLSALPSGKRYRLG